MTKQELETNIALLPKGGITTKTIKAKNGQAYEYTMLQWRENGKQKSRIVSPDEIDHLCEQIEKRKELEKQLSLLSPSHSEEFNTTILVGESLRKFCLPVREWNKRECISELHKYVHGNDYNRIFILYGLRRTGKTTLIKQILSDMDEERFSKSAYIQITSKDNLGFLNKDLKKLEVAGYQ